MKGEFLLNTLEKKDKKKGITLVITASKIRVLPFFFKSLKAMDLPREEMHLLVYDNTDDPIFNEALMTELDEFLCPKCRQFRSLRVYKSYLKPKGQLEGSGNEHFQSSKVSNIWLMWKKIFHMIHTETFFQLEDDTLCPPDTFSRLYELLMADSKVGFVTAVETGRNNLPYVPTRLGIHKIDLRDGFLWKRESFSPDTSGVQEIDASGVYCFVARTEAYKSGFENYDPIRKACVIFAMDNVLTYNIKSHGWKCLADFDCWCGHMQVSFGRICIFSPEQALHYVDLWIPECNNYAMGVEIKKPGQKPRIRLIPKDAPCFSLTPEEHPEAAAEIRKIKKIKKNKKNK